MELSREDKNNRKKYKNDSFSRLITNDTKIRNKNNKKENSNDNKNIKRSNKRIKVYQTNARSLRNKFTELVSIVITHEFDIICITESWVSENFNRDLLIEYEIPGYKKFIYQRESRQGGGVILYVREEFTIRTVHNIKENASMQSSGTIIKLSMSSCPVIVKQTSDVT